MLAFIILEILIGCFINDVILILSIYYEAINFVFYPFSVSFVCKKIKDSGRALRKKKNEMKENNMSENSKPWQEKRTF